MTNTYNNRLRVRMDLQQPTGVWTNQFTYDATRRLTNVTSKAGSFGYLLASGAPSTLTIRLSLPNTSYITNAYDVNARLLSTTLKNSSHSILDSNSYSYNPANQRTQQVFKTGSTYNYSYDPIGQLKVADSATASEDRGYTYDAAWNLNYRTNNGVLGTFTVDGKNQLTSAPNPDGTAVYDGNGNMVTNHTGKWLYVYDDENRLIEQYRNNVSGGLDKLTQFVYDGLGRLRIRREYTYNPPSFVGGEDWLLNSETRYVYDGWRVIQERVWDGSDFTPTVSYTRGTDLSGALEGAGGIGGLLARSHGYSSGTGNWSTHNFYHADGNGNITYLVNSSQTLAASYRYDPYGNTISSSGTLANGNVYRFSSKEIHVNTGLYYYGYRWYAPGLQRWLNRDPLGEPGFERIHKPGSTTVNLDPNAFWYAVNSPLTKTDPYGLELKNDCAQNCFQNCLGKYRQVGPFGEALGHHALGHAFFIIGAGTFCATAYGFHGEVLTADILCVVFAGGEVLEAGATIQDMQKIADRAKQDFAACVGHCASQWNAWDNASEFWQAHKPIGMGPHKNK